MWGPYKGFWKLGGLLLLVCVMYQVSAVAVPNIQEVLQAMEDADKKYVTHSMTIEYNGEAETPTEPGKSRFLTRVTTRRDEASGRFEVLSADWRGATAAPEESIPTSRNHRLWTGEKAFDLGISDKTVMFVSKEAQSFVTDNAAYSGGEMLKGTVGSFRPAWDVMAKQADTRVLDSPEVVGGVPCLVLKSSGPYGEMTLWVDDAHEYVIRKLVLLKGRNSLSYGEIELSKFPDATSEWEFCLDIVEVELVDGHYVPVRGTITERKVSNEGTRTSTENIKILSIDFNPDFAAEGAFQLDVPDGTEVWDADVSGLRYTWNKGELIPMVDPEELDALKRATEQMVLAQDSPESVQPQELQLPQTADLTTTKTQPRFPVRTAGSVVLAAIGCVLLFLVIRNRKRVKAANSESRPQ